MPDSPRATRSTPSSPSAFPPPMKASDAATPRAVEIHLDADASPPTPPPASFRLRFPPRAAAAAPDAAIDQDEEWCEAEIDGRWRRIRFHDYHEVFEVPGLYEALFARRLKCASPQRVASLLEDVLSDFPQDPADLRVLDVGAGNGMVGEELRHIGVEHALGIDILPEARRAALRDRPGIYEDYLVADLTDLDENASRRIARFRPNCLTVVAALGYGDIPTEAFLAACSFIPAGGWIVFNIKEDFLAEGDDASGFAALVRSLQSERSLEIQAMRRYRHRLSIHGEPLPYVAIVASKKAAFGGSDDDPPA
jgi:predicted TPR repeat methyltransferase